MPKKLLIITSSGGRGLINTANAKEQEALERDPNLVVARIDVLQDWVWKPFGLFCINAWNIAQRRGNIPVQTLWVKSQPLFDFLFHPVLFFYALRTFMKEDVDAIIDTQNMGTTAIMRALAIFNKKRGKNVVVEKVLVDMPTKRATHFFRSIRQLSDQSRKHFKLTSIAPLLDKGETEEEFWQTTCKLSAKDINCEKPYVRKAFEPYRGVPRGPLYSLKFAFKTNEELQLMQECFSRGGISAIVTGHSIEFMIREEDVIITVLLGSQPAKKATVAYVEKIAREASRHPEKNVKLFVFCAEATGSLFNDVVTLVKEMKDYPKNLSVVPFSFQSEEVIAPLLWRSDAAATRSGGQTAMELMAVSTGKMWIHSESTSEKNLLKGMPGWESAAAVYLERLHGAQIVSVATIDPYLADLMSKR